MPNAYTSQGSRRDVQVTSPTTVLDVEIVSATTIPSGVYFEVPVPLQAWQSVGEASFVEPFAEGIEQFMHAPNVSGGYWSEDVDANGLIAGFMFYTVTVPTPPGKTGPFSTVVQVPITILGSDMAIRNAVVQPIIDAAVTALNRTAGD